MTVDLEMKIITVEERDERFLFFGVSSGHHLAR